MELYKLARIYSRVFTLAVIYKGKFEIFNKAPSTSAVYLDGTNKTTILPWMERDESSAQVDGRKRCPNTNKKRHWK